VGKSRHRIRKPRREWRLAERSQGRSDKLLIQRCQQHKIKT